MDIYEKIIQRGFQEIGQKDVPLAVLDWRNKANSERAQSTWMAGNIVLKK